MDLSIVNDQSSCLVGDRILGALFLFIVLFWKIAENVNMVLHYGSNDARWS